MRVHGCIVSAWPKHTHTHLYMLIHVYIYNIYIYIYIHTIAATHTAHAYTFFTHVSRTHPPTTTTTTMYTCAVCPLTCPPCQSCSNGLDGCVANDALQNCGNPCKYCDGGICKLRNSGDSCLSSGSGVVEAPGSISCRMCAGLHNESHDENAFPFSVCCGAWVVVLAGVLPAGLAPGALLGATVMAGAVGGGVAVRSLTSSLGEGDGRGEPCTSVECMSGVGRWVHDVRRRGLRQVVCPGVCAGVSLCTNLTGFRNTFDKTKKKGKKINSTWVANRMLRCICIIEHHKLTMPTCLADSIPLLPVLPSAAPWW